MSHDRVRTMSGRLLGTLAGVALCLGAMSPPVPAAGAEAAATQPAAPPPEWFAELGKRLGDNKNPLLPPGVKPRIPGVEFRYGELKYVWNGAASVWDPANREGLLLGGHNGGMPFGTVGNWALAEDGKTWRELKSTSAVLDPLREKALAARKPARDGEAVARNVFYAAMEAAKEAEAAKNGPAKLIGEAVTLAGELSTALAGAKTQGWENEAVEHARPLVEKALAGLKSAKSALEGGKVDAAVLKSCFGAQWALDEAADCLAASPGPRAGAAGAYDPDNRCIVMFGGDHFDYVMSDTWIYDCARKSWRQVWPKAAPAARTGAGLKWSEEKRQLVLSGGQVPNPKFEYYVSHVPAPAGEWSFDAKAGEWTGQGGVASGARTYRTIIAAYDPCWYDAAPRGDPAATAKWLESLKPNTWTAAPVPPAPAPDRDWGTAALDPDRDQMYRWTGGHMADPSTMMSTYHLGINRWSVPYVAERTPKGLSFNGRPDSCNHTYLHYSYDTVSKRLICTSEGGTGVYNPDIRDFEFSVDQPFNRHVYLTCTVTTPKGVVLWGQGGQIWRFDYQEKGWKKMPVDGRPPAPQTDAGAIAYDSKRDALWMATFLGYQKPSGNIWRYDMAGGKVQALNPANADSIGKARGMNGTMREAVYLPSADLVLFNNFVDNRQVAYDPGKNRWVTLNIDRDADGKGAGLGGVSLGMRYDARRDLVWGVSHRKVFVLRMDPKTLEIKDPSAGAADGASQ